MALLDVPLVVVTSLAHRSASCSAVANPDVRSSRPSVSGREAAFISDAPYRALASVRPRCSAGGSTRASTVSKNLGEISCKSSPVRVMTDASLVASLKADSERVESCETERVSDEERAGREGAHLDEIEDGEGDEWCMKLLHLLVV